MIQYDLIVVGGGAAGFFCAIQCAERNPSLKILILEKSENVLNKVKISGGGRCNVTHACFDPKEMANYYPRGNKELRGPFHQFLCGDMIGWLSDRGVETHIEDDGRVFPISNKSQTIIDCFLRLCNQFNILIKTKSAVTHLEQVNNIWSVNTKSEKYTAKNVLMATGSTPKMWGILEEMGYEIVPPVPSLFTFNIQHTLLEGLAGISVNNAKIDIQGTKHADLGPLLITHWGLSGPAVLKLSAWAARDLSALNYRFPIAINWINKKSDEIAENLARVRKEQAKKMVINYPLFELPKRLWQRMIQLIKIDTKNYASLNSREIEALVKMIGSTELKVNGKSTFKEEFVTCGGIETKQVNFKTMESKLHPNLFFAGEVNNIDAVTGGFNFQAAWTSGFLAANAISEKY